jgi:PAS domain S-box-containing protein
VSNRPTPLGPEERIALLEGALEASQNGILVLDLNRQIVRYNQQYLKLFGIAAEDLDKHGTAAIVTALSEQLADPGQLLVNRHDLWVDPSFEVLDTLRFRDGRVYERYVAPHRSGSRIIGRVASFRDITSTIRTAQSQRLEAIGRLAGGIAHDLNNALTAIIGYAELALNSLQDGHQAGADVQEIRRAASRAESITRQLLAFSRKQMLEPRLFSLAESITNLGRMLDRTLGSGITLNIVAPPDLPLIYGDVAQIEQAILNIAVNARDAMPGGGRLTLGLSVMDADEAFALNNPPMPTGRYIELCVSDTGHGMTQEVRSHVFEPFFTTKEVGKGTGLGLAMVYGTIKQTGGFIFVDSELGRGSTFRLYFQPADPETPAYKSSARAHGVQPTVLVVEDEESARNLAVTALNRKGYQVLHASTAKDALEIGSAKDLHIDLLLTSADVAGMSGLEVARALVQQHPDMEVVVMSGSSEAALDTSALGKPATLLPKPFTPRVLQQKIDEALIARHRR